MAENNKIYITANELAEMLGVSVGHACVTFDKSNKTTLTGTNTFYVPYPALFRECEVKNRMMKRTISGMTGTGSLAHNRRDFFAENVNQNRVYLNICYRDENLKDVYKELFTQFGGFYYGKKKK